MSTNNLVYRKEPPTEVGWYWLLSPGEGPYIAYVRDYAGKLAIGNCSIVFYASDGTLWAGPIPEPQMPPQEFVK